MSRSANDAPMDKVVFQSPTTESIIKGMLLSDNRAIFESVQDFVSESRTRYFVIGDSSSLRKKMFEKRALRTYHIKDFDKSVGHFKFLPKIRSLENLHMPNIVAIDEYDEALRIYANRMGYTTVLVYHNPISSTMSSVTDSQVDTSILDPVKLQTEYRGKIDFYGTDDEFISHMMIPTNAVTSKPMGISQITGAIGTFDLDVIFEDCLDTMTHIVSEKLGIIGEWFGFRDDVVVKKKVLSKRLVDVNDIVLTFHDVVAFTLLAVDPDLDFSFPMVKTHPSVDLIYFRATSYPFHQHSVYSTPSFNVKWISYYLSRILQWHTEDPHECRRQVIRNLGGVATYMGDLDGVLKINGRRTLLNVSGHLLNYIITSMFIPFNWNVYLKAIKWNMDIMLGAKFSKLDKRMFEEKKLAEVSNESYAKTAWHNLAEYALAVHAARLTCIALGFPCNHVLKIMNYILDVLRSYANRAPKLLYVRSITLRMLVRSDPDIFSPALSLELAGGIKSDQLFQHLAVW